jgi:hypothetical protein
MVYETTHDFNMLPTFNYSGQFTPAAILTNGAYRLKLEIFDPLGSLDQTSYQDLYINASYFSVYLKTLQKDGLNVSDLSAGSTYTIPIEVKNLSSNFSYDVQDGKFLLLLKSKTGQELYRKQVTGIKIKNGETIQLSETFTFNPTALGEYHLQIKYWDETRDEPVNPTTAQVLRYSTGIVLLPDKSSYNFMDVANIGVQLDGLGSFHLSR